MKRSPLSSVRIASAVRSDALAVLDKGECLSDFVAQCVRSGIVWRRTQDAFIVRSRDAVERAVHEGGGITPDELLKRVDDRIDAALLRAQRSER
jgi:hypothetical protein